MLTPPAGLTIYVATQHVDFRKGADGLALLAKETLGQDPMKGVAVVFRAKRADRVKIVVWDGTGLVMYWKRLDSSGFKWPPIVAGMIVDPPHQGQIVGTGHRPGAIDSRTRQNSAAHIAGEPTRSRRAVRPSPCARGRSSPGPLGQEIPFDRQLANLGIKLRRLALVLLLAVPQSARARREQARQVVQNLLLPAIDLVRVLEARFTPAAISLENRFACPTTRLVELSNLPYACVSFSRLCLALERAARAMSSTCSFTVRLRSHSLAPVSPAIVVIFFMVRISTRTPSPNKLESVG